MSKTCIFNNKKLCNDCGECEVCELNANKKCNNCGKCLELEGYDVKAIKIDEVFEESEAFEDEVIDNLEEDSEINETELSNDNELEDNWTYENDNSYQTEEDNLIPENNEVWEYIDDIEGVKELLEDDASGLAFEEFPGFIRLDKYKN